MFCSSCSGHEQGFCMMCTMQAHVTQALSNSGNVIKPMAVISDLRRKPKSRLFVPKIALSCCIMLSFCLFECQRDLPSSLTRDSKTFPLWKSGRCTRIPTVHSWRNAKSMSEWQQQVSCKQKDFPVSLLVSVNWKVPLDLSVRFIFRLDRHTQATTLVCQIFGGYLRSRGMLRKSHPLQFWCCNTQYFLEVSCL